jgi:hypothetical protein
MSANLPNRLMVKNGCVAPGADPEIAANPVIHPGPDAADTIMSRFTAFHQRFNLPPAVGGRRRCPKAHRFAYDLATAYPLRILSSSA